MIKIKHLKNNGSSIIHLKLGSQLETIVILETLEF